MNSLFESYILDLLETSKGKEFCLLRSSQAISLLALFLQNPPKNNEGMEPIIASAELALVYLRKQFNENTIVAKREHLVKQLETKLIKGEI